VELNGTTFVLEIINFVILVWILKHFLYRPVLDVIAERKAAIEKTLAEAKNARAEADALHERYDARLEEWNAERARKLAALADEIDAERGKRLVALEAELGREKEKAAVRAERREADMRVRLEEAAFKLGARFASRLLKVAAAPELEAHLIDHAVAELKELPEDKAAILAGSAIDKIGAIKVLSAYSVAKPNREALVSALTEATHLTVPVTFEVEPALLAGLEITIGARVLALNLRDELVGFAALANGR
jgi:F-type H+-transporting ATPase subunit b